MKGFKFLDHTADTQSHSWGKNLEEAFSQCALSLMTIISPNLKNIAPEIEKSVKIEAEDKEALLFDFLSELLYIFDVDGLIFCEISVNQILNIEGKFQLEAKLKGEPFNTNKHEIGTEVKAITYSFIEIIEQENKVDIKIVFDL
ncbi:MAG: archease [Promethearchaeota archaeon]